MNEIRKVLRVAAMRLYAVALIRSLVLMLAVGLGAMTVLRALEGMLVWSLPWGVIAGWSVAGVVLSAAILAYVTRVRGVAVARRVDEGAQLKEALSTAVCVADNKDAWSRAAVESAAERARGVKVSSAVPIKGPRFWPVPVALALALVAVWFVADDLDLLGLRAKKLAQAEQEREIVEAKAHADAAKSLIESIEQKFDLSEEKAEADAIAPEADAAAERDPEAIRRSAVKQLSNKAAQLESKKLEGAEKAESLKDKLNKLKMPGEGALTELSRSLSQGNFKQASAELEKLAEKAGSGKMDPKESEQLKQQLQSLAEQLKKLAEDQKDLEKMLEKAGLNKELATDTEKLAEALKEAQNLSEEQKEQLEKMAQAQQQACQQCDGMASAMSEMAQGLNEQGLNQKGMQGMENLGSQLSDLEQMMMDVESIEGALSECQGALAALSQFMNGESSGFGECEGGYGTGKFALGETDRNGNGSGGPGTGGGQAPGEEAAPYTVKKEKAKVRTTEGAIIGSRFIEGEQIKGESRAAFMEAVEAASKQATEDLDSNQYPREYHDAIKHYFGRLTEKVKASEVKSGEAPAAPAPAPAPAAKDAASGDKK